MKPLSIEEAPRDGSWVLVHCPDRAAKYGGGWLVAAWGDGALPDPAGWYDIEGYRLEPTLFARLPDPQPEPTGWRPPEGTIRVVEMTGEGWSDGKGNPIDVPWRWQVYIDRADGTYDEYRDTDFEVTADAAMARAVRWQQKFGLPIAVEPLPSNVVPMRPKGLLQ